MKNDKTKQSSKCKDCVNTLNINRTDTCNRITAGVYLIKSLQPGLKNKNNQRKKKISFFHSILHSVFSPVSLLHVTRFPLNVQIYRCKKSSLWCGMDGKKGKDSMSITVKSQSKFFKHIKRWFKFKHETNRKDLPPQCFTK